MSKRKTIVISDSQAEAIQKLADNEEVSFSHIIRQTIKKVLGIK